MIFCDKRANSFGHKPLKLAKVLIKTEATVWDEAVRVGGELGEELALDVVSEAERVERAFEVPGIAILRQRLTQALGGVLLDRRAGSTPSDC